MRKVLASVGVVALAAVGAVAAPQTNGRAQSNGKEAAARVSPAARGGISASDAAAKLPVERVVLYKSGVGYFEHEGRVNGDQTVSIDFTSGQLNDVLQSLTVLDLNGGRIAGIDYNSEAPLNQRLGALQLPLAEKTNLAEFYGALRGARLEIHSGTSTITGRLLSMERKTRVSGGTTLEVDLATLVSDSGDVRSVEITPAVSVQLADRDVTSEVERYLSLLSSERDADLRRMTIHTAGSGERELYVSYISEVPVWKTTYRIVLPSKPDDDALLQGWAIVDNTVGEDWDNVELSLVAGAPQSFIQQLSQPYYARRPVVPLPQNAQLTPQTHESAMVGGVGALAGTVMDASGAAVPNATLKLYAATGEVAATATADDQGRYVFGDVPQGSYRLEAVSPGFNTAVLQDLSLGGGRQQRQDLTLQVGSVAQRVTVTAQLGRIETETSEVSAERTGNVGNGSELGNGIGEGGAVDASRGMFAAAPVPEVIDQARRKMEAAANGVDLGDLFEYKLKDRVTIRKNESALVPIVQTHISAEKVSLWNDSLGSPRPLRALWLTNTSPLTLDGGSFSVLENDTFAGEGLTDAIKPGEKRLISYAADLGVRVDSTSQDFPQRVTRVQIAHGMMVQYSSMRQETVYTVRDDDTTARTLVIEYPLRVGWTLAADGPKPDETTSNAYRFRMSLEPKQTATLEVRESKPLEVTYALTNMSSDLIANFVRARSISPAVQSALQNIVAQQGRVAALDDEVTKRQNERSSIFDDQQRLRENLKALKGSAEERALTQRYVQQLNDEETQLATLQKEADAFAAQRDQAQNQLYQMIQNLSMDATL